MIGVIVKINSMSWQSHVNKWQKWKIFLRKSGACFDTNSFFIKIKKAAYRKKFKTKKKIKEERTVFRSQKKTNDFFKTNLKSDNEKKKQNVDLIWALFNIILKKKKVCIKKTIISNGLIYFL